MLQTKTQIIELRPYKKEEFSMRKLTGTLLIVTAMIMLTISSIPYIGLAFQGEQQLVSKEIENETLVREKTPKVAGAQQHKTEEDLVAAIAALPTIETTIETDELASAITVADIEKMEVSEGEGIELHEEIGHLYINGKNVRVDAPLTEGVEAKNFMEGVGHQPGTALPGENGNLVIAGHRWLPTKESPYARIFQNLPELEVGESIEIATEDGTIYEYTVRETEIVDPSEIRILQPTEKPELTIYTCHPLTSTRYRYVVHADLVNVR